MEKTFHFQICTTDGATVDTEASYVNVPLTDGEAGFLPNHAPLLGALKEGVVRYTVDGETHYAAISGGVVSVADNEVILLARSAERAETIDLARAQASERRARERLENRDGHVDMLRAEMSLKRALAREKAHSMIE